MSSKTLSLTDDLAAYIRSVSVREPPVLQELREETVSMPMAIMQITPEQGQFMAMLATIMSARRCIEVGVYTGYSSLCVALALPEDGYIVACDISEEWTAVARRYWEKARVAGKIDLHLAPAIRTLDGLITDGETESYDFAFIDADKTNYWNYYERVIELLRPGGLVLIDNVLWGGSVIDENADDADTLAIRDFNERLQADDRVSLSLIPIGDGLTLARKR